MARSGTAGGPRSCAASASRAGSGASTISWRGAGAGEGSVGGLRNLQAVAMPGKGVNKSGSVAAKLNHLTSSVQSELQGRARAIGLLSGPTRAWLHVNKLGHALPPNTHLDLGMLGGGGGDGGGDKVTAARSGSGSGKGSGDAEEQQDEQLDAAERVGWRYVLSHYRVLLWRLMTDADSSRAAYGVSILVLLTILLSTICFCLETVPAFSEERSPSSHRAFGVVETVTVQIFAADYLLRLLSCPRLLPFLLAPLNIIDLVSFVPWYIELAMQDSGMQGTAVFRIMRLLRVFRVLKLGGRYRKLLVVTRALARSADMLALMAFFVSLTVVVAATLQYFAERGTLDPSLGYYIRDHEKYTNSNGDPIVSPFESIPAGFWWAIVTVMTVGYGDVVPISAGGRIIAAATMLCGILSIALPVAVIGNNFSSEWEAATKASKADAAAKAAAAAAGPGTAAASGPSPALRLLGEALEGHASTATELGDMLQDCVTAMADLQSEFRDQGDLRVGEVEALLRPAAAAAAAATARNSDRSRSGGAGADGSVRRREDASEAAREVVALLAALGLEADSGPVAQTDAAAGGGRGAGAAGPVVEAQEDGAAPGTTPSEAARAGAGWTLEAGGRPEEAAAGASRVAFAESAACSPRGGVGGGGGKAGRAPPVIRRARTAAGSSKSWVMAVSAGGFVAAGPLMPEDPQPWEETAAKLRAALQPLRGTPLHGRMLEEVGEALAKEVEAGRQWRQLERVRRSCELMSGGLFPDLTDLMRSQLRQLATLGREASSLRARLHKLEEGLESLVDDLDRSGPGAVVVDVRAGSGTSVKLLKKVFLAEAEAQDASRAGSRRGVAVGEGIGGSDEPSGHRSSRASSSVAWAPRSDEGGPAPHEPGAAAHTAPSAGSAPKPPKPPRPPSGRTLLPPLPPREDVAAQASLLSSPKGDADADDGVVDAGGGGGRAEATDSTPPLPGVVGLSAVMAPGPGRVQLPPLRAAQKPSVAQ
ncbi:hypothetical protein GPECTOR_6g868 [Gonium pectorale]|uniref:Ion transport domain-containing protein n=1 Tax=Gonium pectorale TaxID=33097 RepID=A0A150GX52_GONPE|nr:hypothetical protein GPECTOR_6g868 [Gonium pectorale]|eukprot:KXZ53950.1 hypothetical protein GPECTOR_6g868 [Gonium pectorale]